MKRYIRKVGNFSQSLTRIFSSLSCSLPSVITWDKSIIVREEQSKRVALLIQSPVKKIQYLIDRSFPCRINRWLLLVLYRGNELATALLSGCHDYQNSNWQGI